MMVTVVSNLKKALLAKMKRVLSLKLILPKKTENNLATKQSDQLRLSLDKKKLIAL